MRLVIREYLGMLKESEEFDALLPDLLLAMNLIPLSKAQIGVRQAGVDIAAVGNDEAGQITLWLFVVKCGDLGRRDWDSQQQSVRQSLDEVRDIYLRNNVAPEHAGLPVKIIVATTGGFKQDFEQNRAGYAATNESVGRTYEFWNGDRIAALIEEHLLNEYLLPDSARSQLRRTLALIGDPDYDLEHFYSLLKTILIFDAGKSTSKAKKVQEFLRALVTTSLALGIVCRWSAQEDNLRSAVIACERTLLWTWDTIRSLNLTKNKKISHGYVRLIDLYLRTSAEYFHKVQVHLHTRDALARYHRESALLTERVFEEIGFIATIGLCHLLWGVATKDKIRIEGAGIVAEALQAFLKTHRCSGSPCYDRHSIEISLGLLLLVFCNRGEHAKSWLKELTGRLMFAFVNGHWFPISTDSFDDLVAFEIDRNDVDMAKLKETSWMLPTVAQWAAALSEDQTYAHLVGLQLEVLKDTCFQIWYPDSTTDEFLYRGAAHFESGISEAPVKFPPTADEMRSNMKKLRTESPVKEPVESSARKAGLPWLDLIASRHFKTPLDPAFWQQLNMGQTQTTLTESRKPE
ncbi:MAG: hypothetical protein PHD01_06120 [Geobacteraceae bacterium]|nr:hypothetical protein [Geobacteraceae bacterium]